MGVGGGGGPGTCNAHPYIYTYICCFVWVYSPYSPRACPHNSYRESTVEWRSKSCRLWAHVALTQWHTPVEKVSMATSKSPEDKGPQNGWLMMETLLKWMIWGYHYFWKHPNGDCFFRRRFSSAMVSWCTRLGFSVEKAGHETQLLSGTESLNQICAETKCFLLMFMLVWLAKLCPSLETLKFLKHFLFISK